MVLTANRNKINRIIFLNNNYNILLILEILEILYH